MVKISQARKIRLNILVALQRQLLLFRKRCLHLVTEARPFFRPRYWLIYLLAFSTGFYLWGPPQGWQRVKRMELRKQTRSYQAPTVETLQKELEQLKQNIRLETPKPGNDFSPVYFGPPASGKVLLGFDWIMTDHAWHLHPGLDIGVSPESEVVAAAEGIVTELREDQNGCRVTLDHGNGWESVYASLRSAAVVSGQKVIKGTVIGRSGQIESGNTLQPGFYFGIYHDHEAVDPLKLITGFAKIDKD